MLRLVLSTGQELDYHVLQVLEVDVIVVPLYPHDGLLQCRLGGHLAWCEDRRCGVALDEIVMVIGVAGRAELLLESFLHVGETKMKSFYVLGKKLLYLNINRLRRSETMMYKLIFLLYFFRKVVPLILIYLFLIAVRCLCYLFL